MYILYNWYELMKWKIIADSGWNCNLTPDTKFVSVPLTIKWSTIYTMMPNSISIRWYGECTRLRLPSKSAIRRMIIKSFEGRIISSLLPSQGTFLLVTIVLRWQKIYLENIEYQYSTSLITCQLGRSGPNRPQAQQLVAESQILISGWYVLLINSKTKLLSVL